MLTFSTVGGSFISGKFAGQSMNTGPETLTMKKTREERKRTKEDLKAL